MPISVTMPVTVKRVVELCGMLLPAVVASERCSYMSYGYNELDGRSERMIGYKHCRWGCCWKFTDPCCSAPLVTPSLVLHICWWWL